MSPAPNAPPRGPLVHTSHKLDVKLFWILPLLIWDLTFNTQQQLFCDNLPPGRTLGLSRLRVRPGMYGTDRRLDWEEFLQERATTTLKRSITLLQLRVLRLPREWSGLWPWVPATLPRERIRRWPWIHPKQTFFQPNSAAHTQLTPAVDT